METATPSLLRGINPNTTNPKPRKTGFPPWDFPSTSSLLPSLLPPLSQGHLNTFLDRALFHLCHPSVPLMESRNHLGWKSPLRSLTPTMNPPPKHIPRCHILVSISASSRFPGYKSWGDVFFLKLVGFQPFPLTAGTSLSPCSSTSVLGYFFTLREENSCHPEETRLLSLLLCSPSQESISKSTLTGENLPFVAADGKCE